MQTKDCDFWTGLKTYMPCQLACLTKAKINRLFWGTVCPRKKINKLTQCEKQVFIVKIVK